MRSRSVEISAAARRFLHALKTPYSVGELVWCMGARHASSGNAQAWDEVRIGETQGKPSIDGPLQIRADRGFTGFRYSHPVGGGELIAVHCRSRKI